VSGRYIVGLLMLLVALASGSLVGAQTRHAASKPSPTPNPLIDQMENVVGELREINVTLGTLRTALTELSTRLDRVEAATTEIRGVATPMREEVRGLYVETSNVRSEISRLEEKSVAEAESLGKSRYVLTLLLVATAVLQLVVLAVLLRSR
jgi:chromosome segregation ATPase